MSAVGALRAVFGQQLSYSLFAANRWRYPLWLVSITLLLISFTPLPALAQLDRLEGAENGPVALVADKITVESETGRVVATGSVEVYFGERTLTARQIVYDDRTGRISAEGDIVLRDASGATVFADTADLDSQLVDGLVRGARSVMGENTRLAAVEARRVDERYNTLSKAVYSPCEVCSDNPTPLWRIRARRVIHDEQERVIHYEEATFDVLGVPIAFLPYFRHPDPTVKRASGFLVPSVVSSSVYGFGVKIPYYWVLGDSADITLTPFITVEDGLILEGEYRQKFRTGEMEVAGSITLNDYTGATQVHGHLDTFGIFELGDGIDAGWDITFTSDDAYLSRFNFNYPDRLTSEIFLRNYREDGYFDVAGVYFQSLRDNEPAGQIPLGAPVIDVRQHFDEPYLGGQFSLGGSGYALSRSNGADIARLSLSADWERQHIFPLGLSMTAFGGMRGDLYAINQHPTITEDVVGRFSAHAGLEARFPLVATSDGGVLHVFEPIVQAIVAPYGGNGDNFPVEDSLVTEFDESNVIDRNHFSGVDSVEEGPRINLAVRYERMVDDGISLDATVGRVYRLRETNAFSNGSGLGGTESDLVASWGASFDPYVRIQHRVRVSDDLSLTRNEFFGQFRYGRAGLNMSYIFLEADSSISAGIDREELLANASLGLNENWSVAAFLQRDLTIDTSVRLGGSLTYRNECCSVDFFVSRDDTSSTNSPASTSFGVQINLLTLGDSEERQ